MRTQSRVAMIGSGAMVVAILLTSVLVQLAGQTLRAVSFVELIAYAVPEAVGMGLLVWVGIYFGARYAAPDQRNGKLAKLVAITYGVLGILLSLPMKTHAVRVDMPSAGDASTIQTMPVLIAMAIIVGVPLGSLFITRVLAAYTER